jgi:hypothetical protein
MRDAYAELTDAVCEIVLVVVVRHDHLGCSGSRGCGCGAGAAVVDDGSDTREECLQVDLRDGQAVGFVVKQCQAGPAP